MSEWRAVSLGEITNKIGSGATPKGGGESYKESGISLIRSQNVLDFKFSTNGLAFIDDSQAHELRNVAVESNDVLLNITGDSVARCCVVPDNILPARVNQHVAIIRANKEIADNHYIFYSLQTLKEELLMQSEIGATRNALTKGMLENLKISIPTLEEQKSIASVLRSLDDKIDLLHRQNTTLEHMAETLFRQWFIEEAQEDWEEVRLENIASVISGYNHKQDELCDSGDYLLSMGSAIKKYGFSIEASRHIKTESILEKYLCEANDIFLTTRDVTQDAELLGSPGIIPPCIKQKVVLGSNLYKLEIKNNKLSSPVIYFLLRSEIYREYVKEVASGTSILMLKKSDLDSFSFKVPPTSTLVKLDELLSNILSKLNANFEQEITIKRIRDNLLPKLMNGEVRVN